MRDIQHARVMESRRMAAEQALAFRAQADAAKAQAIREESDSLGLNEV